MQKASHELQVIKAKSKEAKKKAKKNRKETKANIERQKRAEHIISLCNQRVQELHCCISDISTSQVDSKELDALREEMHIIRIDMEENKNKLNSSLESQSELVSKLHSDSSAKLLAEVELEKAVAMREETLKWIEKLHEQKDVLQGRIKFCLERNAVDAASEDMSCKYREFTKNEIRDATDDFAECMKLKSENEVSTVYKGRLNNTGVVIKMLSFYEEELRSKMEMICNIKHPNLISAIGACFNPKCIVFEYMHAGSLQEFLSSQTRTSIRKRQPLSWYTRIRIAVQVCSGLGFLHSAKPTPIVHNNLKTSKILIDHNLVAKITNFGLVPYYTESQLQSDIRDFGYVMLTLITGRNVTAAMAEMMKVTEAGTMVEVFDNMAGDWPLELAEEFARIATMCVTSDNCELKLETVMVELKELLKKALDISTVREEMVEVSTVQEMDCSDIPDIFLCPIFQEVMDNPHVAADGFSYELEAIQEWFKTGHTTSPMTNLNLTQTKLTPNYNLRALINDWRNRFSLPA